MIPEVGKPCDVYAQDIGVGSSGKRYRCLKMPTDPSRNPSGITDCVGAYTHNCPGFPGNGKEKPQ